jgi:hypothetical protein
MATTVCGHKFCTSCLVAFVLNHKSNRCPICDFCIVEINDSHKVHPMKKVTVNPKVEMLPIAPTLKFQSVAKSVVEKTPRVPPVPRVPNESASDFEKKFYERKLVMKSFNDKKVTFIKPDGSDFLLSEYHKVVALFKSNPKNYVQCDEFSLDDPHWNVPPTIVLIPKTKEIVTQKLVENVASADQKITKKVILKKTKPLHVESVPDDSASDLEKRTYERKIIMRRFNDHKISFIKPDGSDFLLSEYHKVISLFKKDPRNCVQCDEFLFENPEFNGNPTPLTIVLIPKFKEIVSPPLDENVTSIDMNESTNVDELSSVDV